MFNALLLTVLTVLTVLTALAVGGSRPAVSRPNPAVRHTIVQKADGWQAGSSFDHSVFFRF